MKKIILASGSPQRKTLMNILGLPYEIHPGHAQELKKITSSCARFVKDNAVIKARDVARRFKSGIVIGADTTVYVGGKKIIGKPVDMIEAKKNLKLLMSRPHWVYTGIAVVDVDQNREIVDYEKTKIFMNRLSDQGIDEYYRHVSPLDKAGGFNIEGKGSIFIRRIEGCYFNVIGLPLAKLSAMLKKVGVHVLLFWVVLMASGCTTEYNLATEKQETLMYSTDRELAIGASIAAQIEKTLTINTDIDVNERVEKILKRIVEVCDRQELIYAIKVIDDDELNAVSLPGGYIYIYKGLMDRVDNDDQLASVIAHEVGHVTARHSVKRLQTMYGDTFLKLLAMQTTGGHFARGVDLALTTLFFEHAREHEFEADQLAVKYMKKAGYNSDETANMLRILKDEQAKKPATPYSYWRTHPYLTQRIAAVNQEAAKSLEFKDYLNLTE